MIFRSFIFVLVLATTAFSQLEQAGPPIEPGVSHDLAKWRAAHYSDVRYKLNLTLEKMSPVLKGTIEIRLQYAAVACAEPNCPPMYIVLDWRKIPGHEKDSTIGNVTINGKAAPVVTTPPLGTIISIPHPEALPGTPPAGPAAVEGLEHLIFRDGVVMGENVIKLDFTSPILTSGSAVTRYVDKEDGAEYIYSLFVPSDASSAFPVFDQPDLKARFSLKIMAPETWKVVSNTQVQYQVTRTVRAMGASDTYGYEFFETKPISTYVFAFAAGPWVVSTHIEEFGKNLDSDKPNGKTSKDGPNFCGSINGPYMYVRKSQKEKFSHHSAAVFNLTCEGIKYLETYFDYKFPFPKYDLVLIPEFPFGGMEHAGATFLRESSVIFPTEPTKNDQISRANLIFHETAHQWFGDTVTMKWFDDLWLKEGFAEFMAYKTLEKVMPEANAWKVFYERNKQAAYLTDSSKGTTPIYQEIANLSAAKSAYGNIVYRKAPSFLRQAEFYLGPDKFQTAVRAFLHKHEFANAGWEDLVKEFETASGKDLKEWASRWITQRGLATVRFSLAGSSFCFTQTSSIDSKTIWPIAFRVIEGFGLNQRIITDERLGTMDPDNPAIHPKLAEIFKRANTTLCRDFSDVPDFTYIFPNDQDYGYGIFLLDDKSRDYVLKNIGREKDDFLRTMMWGSLWDSVREAELAPKDYVELVVKNLGVQSSNFSLSSSPTKKQAKARTLNKEQAEAFTLNCGETDEGTIQTLLARVSTAMNYYLNDAQRAELAPKVEAVLIDKIQHASTPGQRITYYRAFLNIASTERARNVLKQILKNGSGNGPVLSVPGAVATGAVYPATSKEKSPVATARGTEGSFPLKTKDRFDIVTRLIILSDPEAPALIAELEKTETGDDAKRYAYAAKAGFATAENKAKFWNDFINNKDISESWIEAAFGPFNSVKHSDLTLSYLEKALAELPNLKRSRKIFFVNGWLGAFIGGQRSVEALNIVNKFLADNPNLDKDLRLKILENVDLIERAVKIRGKYGKDSPQSHRDH